MQIVGVLVAVVLGAGWGWLVRLAPVSPFLQDAGAAIAGGVTGMVVGIAVAFIAPISAAFSETGGLGAASVGLFEALLPAGGAIIVVIVARLVLAWSGVERIAPYASVLAGGASALISAFGTARQISTSLTIG